MALPAINPFVGSAPAVGRVERFPIDGDMAATFQIGGMVAGGAAGD